jgi:glycosyltransferase involved in cell wall biosynthesis
VIALHVVATLNHGGTEVTCRDLERALKRHLGVASVIAAIDAGSGSIRHELEAFSSRPVELLGANRIARMFRFFQLCLEIKPTTVVFHFYGVDHIVLTVAARLAGILNYHCKAGNPAPQPGSVRAAKWAILLRLTGIIDCPVVSASHWIESSLHRLGKLPARSRVIHNGCDVDGIARRAKSRRRRRSDNEFRIGMISRLDPIKDHATLVRAFAKVAMAHPEKALRLRIIGEGPMGPSLEALARSLSISRLVEFAGNRQDVPQQLGGMDLFVFSTTRDEGFGLVIIEALAAQVPIIASDVPACREVLQDGGLGSLVAPGDSDALAEEIEGHVQRWLAGAPTVPPALRKVRAAYGLTRLADSHWKVMIRPALR